MNFRACIYNTYFNNAFFRSFNDMTPLSPICKTCYNFRVFIYLFFFFSKFISSNGCHWYGLVLSCFFFLGRYCNPMVWNDVWILLFIVYKNFISSDVLSYRLFQSVDEIYMVPIKRILNHLKVNNHSITINNFILPYKLIAIVLVINSNVYYKGPWAILVVEHTWYKTFQTNGKYVIYVLLLFSIAGARQEQDIFVRLIDSQTKQVISVLLDFICNYLLIIDLLTTNTDKHFTMNFDHQTYYFSIVNIVPKYILNGRISDYPNIYIYSSAGKKKSANQTRNLITRHTTIKTKRIK